MMLPEIIDTARLQLRKPELTDVQAIFDTWTQDSRVTRYLTWRPHAELSETRGFIEFCRQRWEEQRHFSWIIHTRETQEIIGMVGADQENAHSYSLGYVLAHDWWGQGITAEAASAVTEQLLDQAQIFRVWAACAVANHASARVMQKAGLLFEGCARRFAVLPNLDPEPQDLLIYARVK